jgi:hypothetical protein
MINKKGDITTQQIVLLIILIASFVVILFFIFKLNLGGTSQKEVCHNSVLTRGSKVLPGQSVPLNCKTNYICITQDNTCERMSGTFEKKKVATADETYAILANEMADCWWIFGEGKINYVGDTFLKDLYCSICSQIAFDDSMNKIFENGKIEQSSLYEYLAATKVSNKDETYLDYLVGLKDSKTMEDSLKTKNSALGEINFVNQYYIVMGIFSKVGAANWALSGAGTGIVLGFAVGGPIGMIIGGVVGGVGGYFLGPAVAGGSGHDYIAPTVIEANSASFDSLKCTNVDTLA